MNVFLKSVIIIGVALVAIIFQGTVLQARMSENLVPNFLVILVVFLAFHETTTFGAVMAFLLGLFYDSYSGLILVGPWAGAFVVVFGLVGSLSQRLFVESGFAVALATFFSALVADLVYVILVWEFREVPLEALLYSGLTALVSAVVSPWMFALFRRFLKFTPQAR